MIYYIDGAGFNGKDSRACVIDDEGHTTVIKIYEEKTNNEMEYRALIQALMLCEKDSIIYTDSQLVANQINKGWNINYEHLQELNRISRYLMSDKNVQIKWISREENKAGKYLEVIKHG